MHACIYRDTHENLTSRLKLSFRAASCGTSYINIHAYIHTPTQTHMQMTLLDSSCYLKPIMSKYICIHKSTETDIQIIFLGWSCRWEPISYGTVHKYTYVHTYTHTYIHTYIYRDTHAHYTSRLKLSLRAASCADMPSLLMCVHSCLYACIW